MLHTAVIAGMERELREETGLLPGEIVSTRLTGFARWMERGAKPEFFGITALSVDGATLLTRRTRGAGKLFSAGVTMADVDLGALGDALAAGADITETPALPARLRDDASLPLLLCLRAAALRHH